MPTGIVHTERGRSMRDHAQIIIEQRPFTVNQLFTMHKMMRAKLNKTWRQQAAERSAGLEPVKTPVKVIAWCLLRDGNQQDAGAMLPAVKAALDGIVDAGLIPDDTPEYVTSIELNAPIPKQGRDAVLIILRYDP